MNKMIVLSFMMIFLLNILACHPKDVILTIDNVIVNEKSLQFDFYLTNNTREPIWFCKDMDDRSDIDYQIDIHTNKVMFKYLSVTVPQNIFLEEPIWAKYVKLHPKNIYKGQIKFKLPISNLDPLEEKHTTSDVQISYADTLILEIGYYAKSLEMQKNDCCRDDSNLRNSFVSSFWAEKNHEAIARAQIKYHNIPIMY